jgi:hypothetical protein
MTTTFQPANFLEIRIEGNAMLAQKNKEMLTIRGIPVYPIFGGTAPIKQEGILTSGDLVSNRRRYRSECTLEFSSPSRFSHL